MPEPRANFESGWQKDMTERTKLVSLAEASDNAFRDFQIAAQHELASRELRYAEGKRRLEYARYIQDHIVSKMNEFVKAIDAVAAFYEDIIIKQERFINLRLPSAPAAEKSKSSVPKRPKRKSKS